MFHIRYSKNLIHNNYTVLVVFFLPNITRVIKNYNQAPPMKVFMRSYDFSLIDILEMLATVPFVMLFAFVPV
jgi:glycerophosphoryl diester phosphodiesterase